MNYICSGKEVPGIEDLLTDYDMYDSSSTSTLLKGKSSRGVRAHKTLMEAMFRLQWRAFVQLLSKQEGSDVDENAMPTSSRIM